MTEKNKNPNVQEGAFAVIHQGDMISPHITANPYKNQAVRQSISDEFPILAAHYFDANEIVNIVTDRGGKLYA